MQTEKPVATAETTRISPFITMTPRELVGIGLTGAIVGLVVSVLMYLFTTYVFGAVLCREQGNDCTNAPFYSMIVSMVIGDLAGLAMLARQRIYRPLLIVIAVIIALWGFHTIIAGMVWWLAGIAAAIVFALAYMLFAWLARLRNFIIAIVLTIVVIVAVRFLLAI